ncbi:MAG: polyprenol monophosphomannose synthase [Candidatus Stygibacter australis]|nr:polyprenol monophosphomannose synthase [Candidatus Stygibacter australis]MDP8322602.1 polyprenol monophosphomannose synthase [Candidatus Stygibacter australis]
MHSLVIIPTYNEIENIYEIIPAVLQQDERLELLIVDDNSPDGTAAAVEEIQKHEKRVHLIKRAGKMGLGSAYLTGFKFGLDMGYEYIFEMDADFSHDPVMLPVLLNTAENYDLVIGSRYVKGINVVNWPLSRLILSWGASMYVRIITGMKVKDPTGGFKCFHRRVLESINFDEILSDGYSFQVEMNYRTWCMNYRIVEVPIVFTDRREGQSKMSKKIIREAIFVVWKLRIMRLLRKF